MSAGRNRGCRQGRRCGLHGGAPEHGGPSSGAARRVAILAVLVLALLTGAGCSQSALEKGASGLPEMDTAQVSMIVAQTRAQLPERSAGSVPFQARTALDKEKTPPPEPALNGEGVLVVSGLRLEENKKLRLSLFLEKERYAEGYVQVELEGEKQTWPIAAFDQRGRAAKTFDFTYALVTPEGKLRYFSLIGGRFEENGISYLGFEGTLIYPGASNDLEKWEQAFKIDFGARIPRVPPHQAKVKEAGRLFAELQRNVRELNAMDAERARLQGDLTTLRARAPNPDTAEKTDKAIDYADAELKAVEARFAQAVKTAEENFIRYYEARRTLSDQFSAFLGENHYLWQDRAGKQRFFDQWKVVEFHHPRIDELVNQFLVHQGESGKVLDARKQAMEVITRNDNWDKNPARTPPPQ